MTVNFEHVKKLRQQTGAGIMDCKEALSSSNNDFEKAIVWLRKKNLTQVAKKSQRHAAEGLVSSYIHGEGRIGVLVEVNSETDFVARNETFKDFVKYLRLHIAAMNPLFIREDEIPANTLEKEKKVFLEQAQQKTKKEEMVARISEGLYKKWLAEVCLLHQEFIRPDLEKKQTVLESLNELIAKLGENIVIRRFVRYELGETDPKQQLDFAKEVQETLKG